MWCSMTFLQAMDSSECELELFLSGNCQDVVIRIEYFIVDVCLEQCSMLLNFSLTYFVLICAFGNVLQGVRQ